MFVRESVVIFVSPRLGRDLKRLRRCSEPGPFYRRRRSQAQDFTSPASRPSSLSRYAYIYSSYLCLACRSRLRLQVRDVVWPLAKSRLTRRRLRPVLPVSAVALNKPGVKRNQTRSRRTHASRGGRSAPPFAGANHPAGTAAETRLRPQSHRFTSFCNGRSTSR